jgi:hypothetical protein
MNRKSLWIGEIITMLAVAGCTSTGSATPTTTIPTTMPSADAAQQSADAAAFQAEMEAADQTAQANVHSLEVRLQKEPTADGKLNLIMTRYCQLGGGPEQDSAEKSSERLLLEDLFDKYWHAGGKWSRPIWSATQQHGACPVEFPTSQPAPRG